MCKLKFWLCINRANFVELGRSRVFAKKDSYSRRFEIDRAKEVALME